MVLVLTWFLITGVLAFLVYALYLDIQQLNAWQTEMNRLHEEIRAMRERINPRPPNPFRIKKH